MSDVTLLRQNAIVKNASVGTSPPHGQVRSGDLPLVQVKAPPGGPQIQEGQQKKLVTILPPKDAESAVKTGGLPMVKIKMIDGKPKPDDGIDEKVVIRNSKHGAVSAGGLPMIQVKRDSGGKPQIQTIPNVAGGPPQIPSAPPALSTPRVARAVPTGQGYVVAPVLGAIHNYPARGATPVSQPRVARIAAPQVPLPPVPEFTTDQLMLCRHLADKYLDGLLAAIEVPIEPSIESSGEEPVASETVQLARATIATIDDVLIATAVRAEAAAKAAAAPAAVVPALPTVAAAASASIAPTPSVAHTAGRVGAHRSYSMPGARVQRNAGIAPRRTARQVSPLPPVIVKMDGERAVVQNQAEIAEAKAALEALEAQTAPEATDAPQD